MAQSARHSARNSARNLGPTLHVPGYEPEIPKNEAIQQDVQDMEQLQEMHIKKLKDLVKSVSRGEIGDGAGVRTSDGNQENVNAENRRPPRPTFPGASPPSSPPVPDETNAPLESPSAPSSGDKQASNDTESVSSEEDVEIDQASDTEVEVQTPSVTAVPKLKMVRKDSDEAPSKLGANGKSKSLASMGMSFLRTPRSLFRGPTPKKLKVFVATFNAGNSVLDPMELESWLPKSADALCDVIAIGMQEVGTKKGGNGEEPPKLTSNLSTPRVGGVGSVKRRPSAVDQLKFGGVLGKTKSKDQYEDLIMKHFGHDFKKIASESLGDMRLIVIARKGLTSHISHVKKAHKATGIGGVLANKGGMMIKLCVNGTDLCFLACHLAAHESEEKVNRRNQDVFDILKATSNASKQQLDIAQRFHHTFLFGDLNYRINMSIGDNVVREDDQHRGEVLKLVKAQNYAALYKADQLQREVKANNVLRGFKEACPSFPPTFKLIPGSKLDYNLHRVPSYCDRILWTSLPGLEDRITQLRYGSAVDVTSSDHKPVYSMFVIDTLVDHTESIDTERALSPSSSRSTKYKRGLHIQVSRLKALNVSDEIYGCPDLGMKFHSTVLMSEKVVCPKPPAENETNFLVDMCFDVPALPLKTTQNELYGKQLIITMWADKSKCRKLLGQAVLSLNSLATTDSEMIFDVPLLRYGVACGELSGILEVSADGAPETPHPMLTTLPPRELSASFVKNLQGVDLNGSARSDRRSGRHQP